jgi:hypothetical protein
VALDIDHDIDARQMLRKLPLPPVTSSLAAAQAAYRISARLYVHR